MSRYFAFVKLRSRPEIEAYIQRDETSGDLLIHTSVYEVAASMPLNSSWEFDPDAFFAKVAELYALDPD